MQATGGVATDFGMIRTHHLCGGFGLPLALLQKSIATPGHGVNTHSSPCRRIVVSTLAAVQVFFASMSRISFGDVKYLLPCCDSNTAMP